MNICIDMRPALSTATGVGVYLQNMVRALADLDEESEYHLFSSSWKERFPEVVYGKNFRIHDHRWPVKVLNYSWHRFSRPRIETLLKTRVDIAHSPTPLLIPSTRARKITTVHDLYFFFHPEDTAREIRRDYPALFQQHCRLSDAIIAVSDHTKQQLVEHLKIPASRVYTIRHGADPFFSHLVSSEESEHVRRKFGIQRPYFLFVGTLQPRKNLLKLMQSFRDIRDQVDLVLAGPEGWSNSDWRDLTDNRVLRTGYVSKEELRVLYQRAIALVFPSQEEGFGLPLLEAMAAGVPILASCLPVFREIGNDCFVAVDSNNVEQLRDGMLRLYSDQELRDKLIKKGREQVKKFSWHETAVKTLDLYRNL